MATFGSAQAIYGLTATGTPAGTNVSGTNTIGVAQTRVALPDSDVAYSLRCILLTTSASLSLNMLTGSTSGSTAYVAGTAQQERASAVGTITLSGNATVVVTADGLAGSPLTVSVPVVAGDIANVWAGKVRTALSSNTAIAAMFSVGGTNNAIVLTRDKGLATFSGQTIYLADDGTLNISLDNGTCTGITTAGTSTNQTAGVATSGALILDGDGNDYEGVAIPAIVEPKAFLISVDLGNIEYSGIAGAFDGVAPAPMIIMSASTGDNAVALPNLFEAAAQSDFTITVIGQSA